MTDLEALRKENIKRNQGLLKKLNLDALNKSIADDVRVKKEQTRPKRKPKPKPKPKEPVLPTRRSRRLAAPHELTEDEQKANLEEERARERQEKLRILRLQKLTGSFTLGDLLMDRLLGNLKHEERVLSEKLKEEKEIKVRMTTKFKASNRRSLRMKMWMNKI